MRKHLAVQLQNSSTPENSRNGTARQSFGFCEVPMTSRAIEGACAFAWRNYLLVHSDISEDDIRRSALYRYPNNLRETDSLAQVKPLELMHQGADVRPHPGWGKRSRGY